MDRRRIKKKRGSRGMKSVLQRLGTQRRVLLYRYGIAGAAALLVLVPWLAFGDGSISSYFLLFAMAVTVTAMFGGLAPALFTSVIGVAMTPSVHKGVSGHAIDGVELAAFTVISVVVGAVGSFQRRKRRLDMTRAVASNLGEGVVAVDPNGRVLFMNPMAEQALGWRAGSARGDRVTAITGCRAMEPPADFHTRSAPIEETFMRRDGASFPVMATWSPLEVEGDVIGSVLTFHDITERRAAEKALRDSADQYRRLIETSPDALIVSDSHGYIMLVNDRAAQLFGYPSREALMELSVLGLLVPEDRSRALDDRRALIASGESSSAEYLAIRHDGSTFPAEMILSAMEGEQGQPQTHLVVVRDITRRREVESERERVYESLRESRRWLQLEYDATKVMVDASTVGDAISILLRMISGAGDWDIGAFWGVDDDGQLVDQAIWTRPGLGIGPALGELRVLATETGLPNAIASYVEPVWMEEEGDAIPAATVGEVILHGGFGLPIFVGGRLHSVLAFFSELERAEDREWTEAVVAIGTQFGRFIERRVVAEKLESEAMRDSLTGLPNRALLVDRLQRATLTTIRYGQPVALLLLDIDGLDSLNQTYGYRAGDAILREVALRLHDTMRESDTVARVAGDAFALILLASDEVAARAAAERIAVAVKGPYIVEHRQIDVRCSIGLALCPDHGDDAMELMQRAEIAVQLAKQALTGYRVYDVDNVPDRTKLPLGDQLRRAIAGNALTLYYQPTIDPLSRSLDSLEALMRWDHPEEGVLGPTQLLPLAEEAGLTKALTMWPVHAAIREIRTFHDEGHNVRVAVNLAAHNLHDPDLAEDLRESMQQANVDPSWLQVEFSETAVMAEPVISLNNLARLHSLGVSVAIDSFGSGYSSLTYLKRARPDRVKVDSSIVVDMAENDDHARLVRSIIDLGHSLRIKVAAPGVENRKTWDVLTELGCDLMQGFYVGEPMPAKQVMDHINRSMAARQTA